MDKVASTSYAALRVSITVGATMGVLIFASCNREQLTAPGASDIGGNGPARFTTATALGTYSIPIPPDNTGGGGQAVAGTGIIVTAGTYYRVRVSGSVTVSENPTHEADYPGGSYPWVGTYGPGGTGNYTELQVLVSARNADGSGTTSLNFVNLQYGRTAPDSTTTDVLYASKDIEIQAGRYGITAVSNDNCCHWGVGFYDLSSSELVTVEKLTDVAHIAARTYVRVNQVDTFTATRDDGISTLNVSSWHWQPDSGKAGSVQNPCIWWNPCTLGIPGSGTMTVYTNVGSATTHVTAYSSFTVGVDPTRLHAGDTATFTPYYDGVAGPAAAWRWAPDDTSSDRVACGGSVTNCKKAIHVSGTMWAYSATTHGDSASAHVGTYVNLHLQASNYTPLPRDTVTFTPSIDNVNTTAARYRWLADTGTTDTQACGAGPNCRKQIRVSGTMWAYLQPSGGDSASAYVTLSDTTTPPDTTGGGGSCQRSIPGRPTLVGGTTGHSPLAAYGRVTGTASPRRGTTTSGAAAASHTLRPNSHAAYTCAPPPPIIWTCSQTAVPNGRDSLQTQYKDTLAYPAHDTLKVKADTVPPCAQFDTMTVAISPSFTWSVVQSHSTGGTFDPPFVFAIFRQTLKTNLEALHTDTLFSLTESNRIYSTPHHNYVIDTLARDANGIRKKLTPNSRHIYGDAADISIDNRSLAEWNSLLAHADTVFSGKLACVEPREWSATHFHVDFRRASDADAKVVTCGSLTTIP
jgi:hypothetical protein